MNVENKLNHLSDFICHRADIMLQNPNRWLGYFIPDGYFNNSYFYLPTLEYYLKN